MAIIGFNFTRMEVERLKAVSGKIKIDNNISIKNVLPTDLALGKSKEKGIIFKFEFISSYDPKVANLQLYGEIIFMEEEKKIQDILDTWKKNKKVPGDVMTNILNNILSKCTIEALLLSKELNLPPPVPLPKVSMKEGISED